MQSVVVAEIISALALFAIFLGMLTRRDGSVQTKRLMIFTVVDILWAIIDCASILMNGPSYAPMLLWGINLLSYCMGGITFFLFLHYVSSLVKDETFAGKYFFLVSKVLLLIHVAFIVFACVSNRIFIIEGGSVVKVGSIPLISIIVQIALLILLPLYALMEREKIGDKVCFTLISYEVLPFVIYVLMRLFVDHDYTVVAALYCGIIVTELLQSDAALKNEQEHKRTLVEKNAELEAAKESLSRSLDMTSEQLRIIHSLSKVYSSFYVFNIKDDTFVELGTRYEKIREIIGKEGAAQVQFETMCERIVAPESYDEMKAFVDFSTLNERLKDRDFITQKFNTVGLGGWSEGAIIVVDRDEDGSPHRLLWATRTIEEEKRKELEYEASLSKIIEEQQKSLSITTSLADSYLAVYYIDLEKGRFQEIVPTSLGVIGKHIGSEGDAREKFIEMSKYLVVPEQEMEAVDFTNLDTVADRLMGRKSIEHEFNGPHAGWFQGGFIAAKRDDEGRCTHVIWTARSIADQKAQIKHERALLLDLKMLLAAMDTVYPRVAEVNLTKDTYKMLAIDDYLKNEIRPYESFTETVNRAAMQVPAGGQRDEYLSLFSRDAQIAAYNRGDKMISFDHQQLQEDGEYHWWRTQVIFVENKKDIVQVAFANCIDEEIEKQVTLRKAITQAESANRAKTTFLFNMSHDIRTPMNAILGFAKLIENRTDEPLIVSDYLKKIEESGEYLLSIINNVLDMARIESGRLEFKEDIMDLEADGDQVPDMFSAEVEKKQLEFIHNVNVKHRYVLADRARMNQIVINLLSNAIKYTPNGGRIELDATEIPCNREGYATYVISVTDTGIGMSREFKSQIFDSFAREKTTTESKVVGTGLGMSIVKKLVDIMGGSIEVESELGVGSTFRVIVTQKIVEDPNETKEKLENATLDISIFRGKRILLAEDNDLNAELATVLLEDVGLKVDRAVDGVDCVDMLGRVSNGYYDLILMDIQMPVMNGYKATEAIRKFTDTKKASIPIIAMTANAFDEDKQNAFDAGMNDHIAKPINVKLLLSTIAKYIER